MRVLLSCLAALSLTSLSLAACVGDEPSATSGPSVDDASAGDAGSTPDGNASDGNGGSDAGTDARPAPTPVGTFAWKNIYANQTNVAHAAYDNAGNLFVAINYAAAFDADGTHHFAFAGSFDDIAILKLSSTGTVLWTTTYATASDEEVNSIASDGTDAYLVGDFNGPSLDFGNGKVATNVGPAGERDPFAVKLRGSDGQAQWVDNFASASATAGNTTCTHVAFGGGRLGVVSMATRAMQFTLTTNATQTLNLQNPGGGTPFDDNFFLSSLDPATGKAYWADAAGGDFQTTADAIAVGADGTMAVAIMSNASQVTDSIGTLAYTNPRGSNRPSFFVLKVGAADGHAAWTTKLNDAAQTSTTETSDAIHGIAYNSKGDVLVSGQVFGTVPIGSKNLIAHDTTNGDAFVADFDGTTGSTNWALAFGGTATETAGSIAIDPWDDIFLVGDYASADFTAGSKTLPTPAPGRGTYVMKLDPTGNIYWAFGAASFADAGSTVLDLAGDTRVAVDPVSGGVSWLGAASNGAEVDFGDGKPFAFSAGSTYIVHRAP